MLTVLAYSQLFLPTVPTNNNCNQPMGALMSRIVNASRNIFWGLSGKIITLFFPFIIRSAMIKSLGLSYVGLSGLFTSVLQILSFAELGIGSAIVFSMYKPMADGDDKQICALLNLYRKLYRIIGGIVLLLGLLFIPILEKLIAGEIPNEINITFVFIVYLLNNTLSYFLFAYRQSLFISSQRVDVMSKLGIAMQSLTGVLQVLALYFMQDYYLYILVFPIVTIINNLTIAILTHRFFPKYKHHGQISKVELQSIEKKVGGMLFQRIGGIVLTSVDTLVISSFLGLRMLALYQNYYYVITALFGFLVILMQAIIPVLGNSIASESIVTNLKYFKRINFLYVWLVSWCSICLLCLYQPFMTIWVGSENMLPEGITFLFTIYFFFYKWCDVLYIYQEACGIWWETRFVPIFAALLNLITNIVLVKIIGLAGILLSTIISMVLIYNLGYGQILFKTYFKGYFTLGRYLGLQISNFLSFTVACMLTYALCKFIKFESPYVEFFINLLVCIIIPNVILGLFSIEKDEFKFFVRLLLNRLEKIKMYKD